MVEITSRIVGVLEMWCKPANHFAQCAGWSMTKHGFPTPFDNSPSWAILNRGRRGAWAGDSVTQGVGHNWRCLQGTNHRFQTPKNHPRIEKVTSKPRSEAIWTQFDELTPRRQINMGPTCNRLLGPWNCKRTSSLSSRHNVWYSKELSCFLLTDWNHGLGVTKL